MCPETLIETTFSSLKSHSRLGTTKGATNPPLAASTWMGVWRPFLMSKSLTALTSSYSPVYVLPKMQQMPMVFSSTRLTVSSGSMTKRSSVQ